MKTAKIRKTLLLAIGGMFVWWAWKSPAQDAGPTASLQMPYAVSQVLQLEQAKIGDATVIAYIRNSGTSYNLSADQIVFLRQQGVSDAVITTMLTQPRTDVPVANAQPTGPAPQYASAPQYAPTTSPAPTTDPTVISQPQVTYVQTTPVTYDYSNYYPYPSYACYGWPFSWAWYGGGWHWGWHGGGGWHGGWSGGGHGGWTGHGGWGGGFHGGFHGGFGGHSGGWHGGGGHR